MDNKELEKKIQQKGLTGKRITYDEVVATVVDEDYHVFPKTQLTVCCLTLRNGFTVTGESACVDPANFNKEIGEEIAKNKAISNIWGFEAYLLQQKIFESTE